MTAASTHPLNGPLISVLVPCLNEEKHIEQCVAAIQSQTHPRDQIEIIVVDGGSTDESPAILKRLRARDTRIQLIDNPGRTVVAGLNVGLARARGDYVLRVDAHSIIAPDYVERCVALLNERSEVGNVGGILQPVGETITGEAIAAALQSPFSMGWSPARYRTRAGETDTVYLGAFRRAELEAVGQFNPALEANEDYELNIRLRATGRRIWCDPAITSRTFTRPSSLALIRQYARYGYWKMRVAWLHPKYILLRHLMAPAFVLALLLTLVAGIGCGLWWPLWALCGSYTGANLGFAWRIRSAAGRRARPLIPLALVLMHLSWGIGFWAGLLPAMWATLKEGRPDKIDSG